MYESLVNSVIAETSGAPTELIKSCLLRTCRDFAKHTGVVNETFAVPIVEGQEDYNLGLPEGFHLGVVEAVEVKREGHLGRHLRPYSAFAPSPNRTMSPMYRVKSFADPATVSFSGVIRSDPADPHIAHIRARLVPTDLEALSGEVFTVYEDALRIGTLSMLYRVPNRPWTAPAYAAQAARSYIGLRSQARQQRARGGSQNPYPTTTPKVTER